VCDILANLDSLTMNYTVCVICAIAVIATFTWIFHGRTHYTGPRDISADLLGVSVVSMAEGGDNK
jgi:hypothetical protein